MLCVASRAEAGWVDPADCPVDQPGMLKDDYSPGDLKFGPPEDAEEFDVTRTKELQNGLLAMLAAARFLAQEAVDGQGKLLSICRTWPKRLLMQIKTQK